MISQRESRKALWIANETTRKARTSGGLYVNRKIGEVLGSYFEVRQINVKELLEPFSHNFIGRTITEFCIIPSITIYTSIVSSRYGIVFAEWDPYSPVFCDFIYVQPFAGANRERGVFYDPVVSSLRGARKAIFRVRKGIMLPFKRASLMKARIICNSLYTSGLIKRELGRHARVVYPPVDVDYTIPSTKENLVVTVSRVSVEKNLDLLSKVGPFLPEFKFVLIGKISSEASERVLMQIRESFRNRGLSNNFQYCGYVSEGEKKSLLQRSMVLFHPTINEAFGLSIVEAMAAGCVPVVHDSGGPREFVPPEWRFTTDLEALDKIARAGKSWDRQLAMKMAELARRYSSAEFRRCIIEEAQSIALNKERRARRVILAC